MGTLKRIAAEWGNYVNVEAVFLALFVLLELLKGC